MVDVKTAVENLKEIKEVFDKHGIRYWLDCGTLLGAVRDGKMIEWDDDVDLSTTEDNWDKVVSVIPELEERGFHVRLEGIARLEGIYKDEFGFANKYAVFNKFGCIMGIGFNKIKGETSFFLNMQPTNFFSVRLGLLYQMLTSPQAYVPKQKRVQFIRYLLSIIPAKLKEPISHMMWCVWMRSGVKFFSANFPKHHFEKLGTTKFHGITFNIPSDVENYLKYRYGDDWRTPKKKWEWLKMDSSVKPLKA